MFRLNLRVGFVVTGLMTSSLFPDNFFLSPTNAGRLSAEARDCEDAPFRIRFMICGACVVAPFVVYVGGVCGAMYRWNLYFHSGTSPHTRIE